MKIDSLRTSLPVYVTEIENYLSYFPSEVTEKRSVLDLKNKLEEKNSDLGLKKHKKDVNNQSLIF